LGGGSWKKTGSDGLWLNTLGANKVLVKELKPSNCGFRTTISLDDRIPLKNISMSFKGITLKGESLIYNHAIEGGVIYHLSSYIRDEIALNSVATVIIDFKPGVTRDKIIELLKNKKSKTSWSNHVNKVLKLDKELLSFITKTLTKNEYFNIEVLTDAVKSFSLNLELSEDIDLAISTGGGVSFDSLNRDFSLLNNECVYIGGEMIDWEAPTGGFLIQGCYSIGHRIVQDIITNKHIKKAE
jgi:predicted flavoprotein YhiN